MLTFELKQFPLLAQKLSQCHLILPMQQLNSRYRKGKKSKFGHKSWVTLGNLHPRDGVFLGKGTRFRSKKSSLDVQFCILANELQTFTSLDHFLQRFLFRWPGFPMLTLPWRLVARSESRSALAFGKCSESRQVWIGLWKAATSPIVWSSSQLYPEPSTAAFCWTAGFSHSAGPH